MSINQKTRLGKGLEALIPKTSSRLEDRVELLSIIDIKPNPLQPRIQFNDASLEELSASIKNYGLAQPVIVREKDGYYELVAGERRFRASILAQKDQIPAIIRPMSDRESLQIALIENLEREDLNCIEIARGYQALIEEFDLTHDEVGKLFSRNRSTVSNTLRLLRLPLSVQKQLMDGDITEGHARTLLSIPNSDEVEARAQHIIDSELNVRDAESISQDAPSPNRLTHYDCELWQEVRVCLADILKTKIAVKQRGRSKKGKIEIHFHSNDDLERIFSLLR